MNAYAYSAALYCEPCAESIRARIRAAGNAPADPDDEASYDSGDFPKGPYRDGGGEADSPQHCDNCRAFLENPLTSHGECTVREAIERTIIDDQPFSSTLATWRAYYAIDPADPKAIRLARLSPDLRAMALAHDATGATLPRYAWPGGYPLFCIDDGCDVVCIDCANETDTTITRLTLCDVNWEDASLYCDSCSERIESAYADDEAESEDASDD